jgi:uncharacterized protein (DUF2147 family)
MQSRIATTTVSLAIAVAALANPARAAEPTGSWQVEGGFAHIKIDTCGDRLWGIVAWEKKPNIDKNNPDESKRSRPTLGIPVLLGMTLVKPNRWDGEIYNSEDGRTYTAHISLASDDVLRVEGCVLGFLCGSQSWTRVVDAAPPAAAPRANAPRPATPRRTTGQAGAAAPPTSDVCMAVATATGQPIDHVMQTGKRSER